MNVFYVDKNPVTAAEMMIDKHVVKMILETCQLLCSAWHMTSELYTPPYKLTHKNHPSAIWCRYCKENYIWLCKLGIELCKEYTYRYKKTHKCQSYIQTLSENIPELSDKPFTQPTQAMPDIYKCNDSILAYQQYYFFEKANLLTWKNREVPDFILEIKSFFEN